MKTLGPPGRPRGGVGGLSSFTLAIHVSDTPWMNGVGGSSSMSRPVPGAGLPRGVFGGSGWISLGTMTLSLPSTKMAPALLAVPQYDQPRDL